MSNPKEGKTKDGVAKHYSAGVIVKKGGKYLLINRVQFPPGYASPAGHVDKEETPEDAAKRELKEEVGLDAKKLKLLIHKEVQGNICHRGITVHEWFVFEAEWDGDVDVNIAEAKDWGWFSPAEMENIQLEKIWYEWFKELGVLK